MNFDYPGFMIDFVEQKQHLGYNNRDLRDRLFQWITRDSLLPYLVVPLEFDHLNAQQEIQAVEQADLFVPYTSRYENIIDRPNRGWSACALYGVAARSPQNPNATLGEFNTPNTLSRWTEAADLMPNFCRWVTETVGQTRRMVILKFPPGGYVPPHRDLGVDADITKYGLPQVNFHVQWPPGSTWYMEDCHHGIKPTREGTVTMHSFYHEHAVINDNLNENRYFIYGFFEYTDQFKTLVVKGFLDAVSQQVDH